MEKHCKESRQHQVDGQAHSSDGGILIFKLIHPSLYPWVTLEHKNTAGPLSLWKGKSGGCWAPWRSNTEAAASTGPEEGREIVVSTSLPLPGELCLGRTLNSTLSTLSVKHSFSNFILACRWGAKAVDKAWRAWEAEYSIILNKEDLPFLRYTL